MDQLNTETSPQTQKKQTFSVNILTNPPPKKPRKT